VLEIYQIERCIKPLISDYQSGDCGDYCLLGYDAVWFNG